MCDETTDTAFEEALSARGLSRREFAALGASAALAGCAGATGPAATGGDLLEETVRITTEDGVADAFFVRPARDKHPGIIMWPDIAGLRESKRIMARRLAGEGFAVLVVNQYYRSAPAPVMESFAEFMQPEGRAMVMGYRELLTPEAVMRDARAHVAFLDSRSEVDTSRGVGSDGYCMGGPFTVFTAAAVPSRVKAAASFHGGGLVGDDANSPVNLLGKTEAAFLFAIARNDDAKRPDDKDALRKAADAAERSAEVEVYPADHGWMVPDSPVYDPVQADRGYERMLALYRTL
jgi:carboxymethylenebutenolidase